MRNLTIQREKTWVASMVKMKVYIEDAEGDLEIRGVRCHKLGVVENGETATFQISEGTAKLFVIGGKCSRNYCNELYILPEGQEDVVLTGKNQFNLFTGNAFRFHNNETPEVLQNRQKSARKGMVVLAVVCAAFAYLGWALAPYIFAGDPSVPKTFSKGGITITLNESFREVHDARFTACYDSKQAAVFALKEPFSALEGLEEKTVEEYGQLVIQKNALQASEIKTENDLTYYTYKSEDGKSFYVAYLFEVEDGFWLVQCATYTDRADTMQPLFVQWMKSIQFS